MNIHQEDITGLVLAGGRGTRMGGADKGLQIHSGVPLAQYALERLRRRSVPVGIVRPGDEERVLAGLADPVQVGRGGRREFLLGGQPAFAEKLQPRD